MFSYHRAFVLAAACVSAAACTARNPDFCSAADECDESEVCDVSVNRCVPAADAAPPDIDAAVPGIDASTGTPDAAVPDVDAAVPDVDAAPLACEGSHACIEAPPAPWQGPVIRFEDGSGGPPPACTAAYPSRIGDFDFDLTAGGDCDCTCEPATGLSCNAALVSDQGSGGISCIAFNPDTQTVADGACVPLASDMEGPRYRFGEPGITGGSCEDVVVDNLEPAGFDQSSRVCAGATLGDGVCPTGNVCAPVADAPYDGKQCIFLDGDNACPAGSAYSQRFVRFSGVNDTRSCGSCSCGDPVGTCGGVLHFVSSCDSFPILIGSVGPGTCSPDVGSATHVEYAGDPSASCEPSPGSVNGTATPTGPVTLCCLP